ncbi:MAG TPA: WbqC family protein [Vicinamibacteria bacterium]|nr:WbqC family protein [Vicinamibacteria bacterium]
MTPARVVAIHQPNFLPWLGYFDKITRADVFVLLDNVQFPKTGGTWTNRVQIAVAGQAGWITVPVVRAYRGVRLVRDMQIDERRPWRETILKTMQASYGRAPFFKSVLPLISDLVRQPTDSLADYNVAAIRALATVLGLDASKLVLASELGVDAAAKGTDLLIALTRAAGGTTYLCGGGAGGYQDDSRFAEEGIALVYQGFQHPAYPQSHGGPFVPGLSVVDLLVNCGLEEAGRLVRSPLARGTRAAS